VFINDYLVVAWEDYRNGVADIYGKIRSAEAILSTEAVAGETGNHELKLSPNPVREQLRVELPVTVRGTFLELYDLMGRSVLRQEIEDATTTSTLDVSAITSGSYMLVVRMRENVKRQQIVILH
jgi:hypothetical protein